MVLLHTKFRLNNKFSSKLILNYGIHLGGHEKLLSIETSSMVFGIRTRNIIINLNSTSIELVKVLKVIEGIGLGRGVIYFINSNLNFRLAFKYSFRNYNRHLFFPIYFNIKSMLKNFDFLTYSKFELKQIKRKLRTKKFYLIKSGKALFRKMFIASKWSHGFVSNSSTFFRLVDNVEHEKIKFGKMFKSFHLKIKSLLDFYPLLPNYSFVGDNKSNSWIINEFKMISVPCSSVVDTFSTKALLNMYGIPGNSCSIDATLFFLVLTIGNYLVGFYQHIIRFFLNNNKSKRDVLLFNFDKKNYFFKNFKQVRILNIY